MRVLYPLAVIATIPAMILAPVIVAEAALLVVRLVMGSSVTDGTIPNKNGA